MSENHALDEILFAVGRSDEIDFRTNRPHGGRGYVDRSPVDDDLVPGGRLTAQRQAASLDERNRLAFQIDRRFLNHLDALHEVAEESGRQNMLHAHTIDVVFAELARLPGHDDGVAASRRPGLGLQIVHQRRCHHKGEHQQDAEADEECVLIFAEQVERAGHRSPSCLRSGVCVFALTDRVNRY